MRVLWWSAGVSSTVAAMLSKPDKLIYCEIDDHHPDNERFAADAEALLGMKIERIRNDRYQSVDQACRAAAYVNGVRGAQCTNRLKRQPRKSWESANPGRHTYVWGFDANEKARAERVVEMNHEHDHEFPLIAAGMTKAQSHGYLANKGIRRPAMYDLGFPNNNCVGCVKGGMGYWNLIRRLFPQVFAARAAMERAIGGTCIKGIYLDELDPTAGRDQKPIVEECGVLCQLSFME